MSIRAIDWVWRKSTARGIDRLVLLAIADCASDDGGNAWPAVATLAAKCNVDIRTVQRSINRLANDVKELEVKDRGGRNGSNSYRVVMDGSTPAERHPGNLPPRQPAAPDMPDSPSSAPGRESPRQPATPAESPQTPAERHPNRQEPSTSHVGTELTPRKRGTRLPADWRPALELIAWARSRGIPDEYQRHETEKFCNYWWAKAGKDATKLDWGLTWQNWLIRAAEERPPRGQGRPGTDHSPRVHDALDLATRLRAQEDAQAGTYAGQ